MPGVGYGSGGSQEADVVNVRWLWVPLVGASVFLALPGNETIGGVLGDVVGHFFSAALVAVVPVVGALYCVIRARRWTCQGVFHVCARLHHHRRLHEHQDH